MLRPQLWHRAPFRAPQPGNRQQSHFAQCPDPPLVQTSERVGGHQGERDEKHERRRRCDKFFEVRRQAGVDWRNEPEQIGRCTR